MTLTRILAASIIAGFVLLVAPREGMAQNCSRADLQAAVDSYLEGQRNGRLPALRRPAAITYIENTEPTEFEKSIVKTPLKIDFSRSLLDTQICETFTEVIVTDKSHPYVSGMKLKALKFIADPEIGAVVAFIRWPTTVPDTHLFRVEGGKLRFVHSLTVCIVLNCGFQTGPAAPTAPAPGR